MLPPAHRNLTWALIGLIGAVLNSTTVAQSRFQFAPTDKKRTMVERVEYERARTVDGVTSTTNGQSETRVTFEKKKKSYQIDFKLISNSTMSDGRPLPNPVTTLLLELPITGIADSTGRLQEIRGFSELRNRAKKTLPPVQYQRLAPFLAPEALARQFTDEWESRMTLVRGKVLSPGDRFEVTRNIAEGGAFDRVCFAVMWVESGSVPTGSRKGCVKIRVFEDTDLTQLSQEVRRWVPGFQPSVQLTTSDRGESPDRVVNQTIYWIEPETMLVRYELSRKWVTLSQLADGTPVSTVMTEQRRTELLDPEQI